MKEKKNIIKRLNHIVDIHNIGLKEKVFSEIIFNLTEKSGWKELRPDEGDSFQMLVSPSGEYRIELTRWDEHQHEIHLFKNGDGSPIWSHYIKM